MKSIFIALIRLYRSVISPARGPVCRFVPSCSEYAEEAIHQHGAWRGAWLTTLRLLRCQPFCRGGLDPVPQPTGPGAA